MNKTKKTKKERVIVSISLPKDLLDLADERAKQLFKKRSEYFSQLIFFDAKLSESHFDNFKTERQQ